MPGFLVDRLANRTEHAQRAQVVAFHVFISACHQGTNRRGGRIELGDLVFFANRPIPAGIREGGYAFKHDGCTPLQQRPIDNVGVPCDPANVSGTPVHITRLALKYIRERIAGVDGVASVGVDHTLRLSGGA